MYDPEDAECCLCKEKLDSEKEEVEWFVLGKVDYEAAYGLGQYSGGLCHIDCYSRWEYKDTFEKEVKLLQEHNNEIWKKAWSVDASERRRIFEEEARQWNEKVKRNKYSFERPSEEDWSDDNDPEYDFSYLLDELESPPGG